MKQKIFLITMCTIIVAILSMLTYKFFKYYAHSDNIVDEENEKGYISKILEENHMLDESFITTNDEVSQEEKTLIENRIITVVNESYLYYLLTKGEIDTSDESIIYNGKEYFKVIEKNIQSINDINHLIEDLFVQNKVEIKKRMVFNAHRDYIDFNDKLYVLYETTTDCIISRDLRNMDFSYKFDGDDLIVFFYQKSEDGKIIASQYKFIKEDGIYKLDGSLYNCSINN